MDPITVVAIAKSIASAAGLDDWLKKKLGGTLGEKTAKKIADIAMAATGTTTPQDAAQIVKQNADFAIEIRRELMKNEHELTLAALADVQNAREMYKVQHDTADDIANWVITQNHLAVMLLIVANGLVLVYVKDQVLAVAAGNLIGGSIAALWQERQQILNFYFGSSLGSKIKDVLGINKAARDEQ